MYLRKLWHFTKMVRISICSDSLLIRTFWGRMYNFALLPLLFILVLFCCCHNNDGKPARLTPCLVSKGEEFPWEFSGLTSVARGFKHGHLKTLPAVGTPPPAYCNHPGFEYRVKQWPFMQPYRNPTQKDLSLPSKN